ncbi:MAG: hypothetical protein A2X42_04855 [Candidatus Margulisbacteria bacterium GWF2_38_17]|nr:MAG: hypothetical protein A2X43_08125 [Candidatus Margulisbacteria bacterium GWD2_39_127]OGI01657.1 MAG: hypothetical protein A2X42_04855 [Candidatus Margulisbacteria bacterium GWF2_38_17]OGI05868.1 MAG: hypothetical protein A2X41_04520 [Candidatus Margulisbacteria bacterium GWE2_39_32]
MRKRILLVDDELCIRKLVGKLLQVKGYDVIVAEDGEDACIKALQYFPDIIVMDVNMDNTNGFDCALLLKMDAKTKDIPILFYSGHLTNKAMEIAKHIGVNGLLEKSFRFDELIDKISLMLEENPA